MKRRAIALGAVLLVALGVLGALLIGRGTDDEPADDPDEPTTTAPELPTGDLAPLTGLEVPDDQLHLVARPALAVKVDNHPDALPQWGLSDADVVLELRVEGISRFLAVVHSRNAAEIGPVRSARTSDPDLLAMFGRPLTAWSGANPATREVMRSIDWIQDISADRLPEAYRRDGRQRAPHNLVLDGSEAFGAADEPLRVPQQLFEYRDEDEPPAGEPVAGFGLQVGLSRSEYVWDVDRGGWLRWSDGVALHDAAHGGSDGPQVAPANVVVLRTEYASSEADSSSPEAVSVGEGDAWVFTGGHLVRGRWTRVDRTAPWQLTATDGSPIRLSPGTTWVAMPSPADEPAPMSADAAAELASS